MMEPDFTYSPPNFLMPRRRPAVLRPLLEEPPAFFEAKRTSEKMEAGPKNSGRTLVSGTPA
jgi:hypothetical protein